MNSKDRLTWNEKIRYSLPLLLLFVISYIVPNNFQFIEPKVLPLTAIDKAVPLIPWTVFVYMSEWFTFIFVLFFVFDNTTYRRLILSLMFTFFISMVVFFLYPTILVSRPIIEGDGFSKLALSFLYSIDKPVNCFPSQHVALVTIPPLIFWNRKNKGPSLFFGVWAGLVAISTLTTKQHYFIDIPAGLVLSWFSVYLADKLNVTEIQNKFPLIVKRLLPN